MRDFRIALGSDKRPRSAVCLFASIGAAFVSAATAALWAIPFWFSASMTGGQWDFRTRLVTVSVLGGFALLAGLAVAVGAGFPALLVLRSFGALSRSITACVGAILGAISGLCLTVSVHLPWRFVVAYIALGLTAGAAGDAWAARHLCRHAAGGEQ